MKPFLVAILCLVFTVGALAQTPDTDPATKDDIILYLRTMHSHDLLRRTMEVQVSSTQQLLRDQLTREKGKLPPDFDAHWKKAMDDLIQSMPMDEITQAMIPAYQKHFTKGDIEAMNGFYSSPVGQKVLQELPAVMQEGSQAAMPIMSKYLGAWMERMRHEFDSPKKDSPQNPSAVQN